MIGTSIAEGHDFRVALAGNPNTGKTALFNALTGTYAKVGNYPGVTVESRRGQIRGSDITILDLPGCYSLIARSPEEEIAHDALTSRLGEVPPDVIIAVVDANNLSRNLYLVQQLAELGRPVVLALNMMDVARQRGVEIDVEALTTATGMPVVPTVATSGEGLQQLVEAVRTARSTATPSTQWPSLSEDERQVVEQAISDLNSAGAECSLGHTLWLLTSNATHVQSHWPQAWAIVAGARDDLERMPPQEPSAPFSRRLIAARYQKIDPIVARVVQQTRPPGPERTDRIDDVLTHPVWGMSFFMLAMAILFQAVFAWADPLIGLVENAMVWIGGVLQSTLPEGVLRELLIDGLVAGIGNILVFLPQILLLFFAIAILEDTGYMSRVALLLDRLMRRVGLSGKSFVPLLSSFACAIPGIMAARTIESQRDRLVTILIAPLMSCSARLPVYTLVIGAVFSTSEPVLGVLSAGGLIITAMYFLGIFMALAVAWMFKRTLLRAPPAPFIMELPAYKRPNVRDVCVQMWRRSRVFITQTGPIILALSVILWALMAYPRAELPAAERATLLETSQLAADSAEATTLIENAAATHRLRESIAGTLGRMIEPIIEPLGFDWKLGIGLIGSFAAREVLVSTLGQVYGVGSEAKEESVVLRQALLADVDPETKEPRFTPLVGVSLMVFFVLAMQCLSTVAVVRRETASWRWPLVMIAYMNGLAWVCAFATYQVGRLLGYS